MFKIKILASSSSGNCYQIYDGDKHIIIDPGINKNDLSRLSGFTLADSDLCLVSHEHKDHSRSALYLQSIGVTLAASLGTLKGINADIDSAHILESLKRSSLNDWSIMPFDIEHDSNEPLGFVIETPTGKRIMFVTDTSYIRYRFKNIHYYMIECNYSKELMIENDLPEHVNVRTTLCHFEINDVKTFFQCQDLSNTQEIYLLHMSKHNSDPIKFVDEIKSVTGLPTFNAEDLI